MTRSPALNGGRSGTHREDPTEAGGQIRQSGKKNRFLVIWGGKGAINKD